MVSVARDRDGSARRAVADDAVLAEVDLLDAEDDDRISLRALGKQIVSAVLVSALGIGVVSGVSVLSAPYSTATTQDRTHAVGATDTSHAKPAPGNNTDPIGSLGIETSKGDQNADLSQQPIKAELLRANADKQDSARNASLDKVSRDVDTAVRNGQQTNRQKGLTDAAQAAANEQQRRQAEAARAEAERRAAEDAARNKGSLLAPRLPAPVDPGPLPAGQDGGWVTPLAPGTYVRGSSFGETGVWARYHTGVDLRASQGTPIRAVSSGVVMPSPATSWAGNHVVIKHADGGQTLYAHMTAKVVQPGAVVKAGQLIGYVGQTGRAFGAHLHFEYYPPGTQPGNVYSAQDPAAYLLRHGVRL